MDRREFMKSGAALVGGVSLSRGAALRDDTATAIRSFPPYPSADAAELAFAEHVGPAMVRLMKAIGTEIHYGEREGGRVRDAYTGKWYWDCHRNGSLYNLGHRNPDVLRAVRDALHQLEIGNLFLASGYKARAAEALAASSDGRHPGVTFAASGAEANEVAIRIARGFTRRRKIVALDYSYHGSTCFTMAAGHNAEMHARYLLDLPEFVRVPFDDAEAMAAAVDGETAGVLLEASPAQLGFPAPRAGYYEAVRRACDRAGALLMLDEVQTGLGASGSFWYWQQQGVVPDVVTTAKGLGGGLVPNAAVLMNERVRDWFFEAEFPHMSTFGGNELGCVATLEVCRITRDPVFLARVRALAARFRDGFRGAPFRLNQIGMCMGLVSEGRTGAEMTRRLFERGVMVVPATYDEHAIEFRPVLVLEDAEADEIIARVREALG